MPPSPLAASQRFGPDGRFELQPHERRLLVDGEPAALGARAFDLLLALVAQPGHLLTKHELLDRVWPGVVVEENNLATQISSLRKVLGGEVITTIPGRGYRFSAALHGLNGHEPRPATLFGHEEPAAPAALPAVDSPAQAPAPPTNLPRELTPLRGREDDVAALGSLIERHRLVSLVGPGGIGKTLLALHLLDARRTAYPHGVCLVELATVSDAAALPAAVAAALGVRVGSGDPLEGLCGSVAPLSLLVVLDNAEQLVEGVAQLAQALLQAAPGLRVLVTTQVPLKLAAENVFRLGALAVPDTPLPATQALTFGAVGLFAERAQAADARFALTDANAAAAIEICRALDGLPLAIELAAARAPVLGVEWLADSMRDRLQLLTQSRNRNAPSRHQTLRAMLEWSHGFLDERERVVFRRLAVIAGSASLGLIEQMVADDNGPLDRWAVLDALTVLVDRSLVAVLATQGAPAPRYRLLDSARTFALEQLRAAGEYEELRRRHALAVAALCDACEDECDGSIGRDDWKQAMAPDIDNAREALAWARAADDATMVLQIGVMLIRGLTWTAFEERKALCEWCEPMIDRVARADLKVLVSCRIASMIGGLQPRRAFALSLRSLEWTNAAPQTDMERWRRYLVLCHVASYGPLAGEVSAAQAAVAEARAIEDADWPAHRLFFGAESRRRCFQYLLPVLRDPEQSKELIQMCHRAIALQAASGTVPALINLIDGQLAAGDAAGAAQAGVALLAALEGTRDVQELVYARLNAGAAWLALDQSSSARALLELGWMQALRFDMQPHFSDYLALLAALEGHMRAAAALAGYADVRNARRGTREPNEAAAIARATALARAALGDGLFEQLHAGGAVLRDDDIAALAFADHDVG